MSDITYIGKQVRSFDSSPEFDGYSRVVITVSEDLEYTAGTDAGRTLTMECPWGTQAMADNILTSIRGFRYKPYTATDAVLDPAVELGDGATINNVYGGIYTQKSRFGSLYTATVAAPSDEEVDHEYPYIPAQDRKVTRRLYNLSAELKVQAGLISAEVAERKSDIESLSGKLSVQAGEISAKVSKTGGDASSFGWVLDDSSWTIKASGVDVLKATKSGLEVSGKITAKSGKIGGFDINTDSLSYNNMTWGGTNSTGIYVGPSGIQLGKNFKVDASGNLTAASGTFTGYVRANKIQYGGSNGYLSGGGISSGSIYGNRLVANTVTTAYTSGGINTTLGYADFANGVFNDWNTAPYVNANYVKCKILYLGYTSLVPSTITYKDASGVTQTKNIVTWSSI